MNIIKLNNDDEYVVEQKLQGHSNGVLKVIEIRENELISVSYDKTMKKWEIKNNKYECTKTINFQNSNSYCNILKLNENEFVTSSCGDKCLKFWNSYDYSNISTINNVETHWTSGTLCMLDNDILCVGGNNSKGFYLIKISNHQIIKNILGPKEIYCIYECYDGLFLCSIKNENGNCALVKYKYENENMNKIIEKEKIHEGNIYTCIELNDGTIASGGSSDYLIKLWRN
jgi:WD40 repeat protein